MQSPVSLATTIDLTVGDVVALSYNSNNFSSSLKMQNCEFSVSTL